MSAVSDRDARERFVKEEELRAFLGDYFRQHDCREANCQIYPDGTRRRNPDPGEPNASPTLPLLAGPSRTRDNLFSRPPIPQRVRDLLGELRGITL